ncbi:MAG: alpha/beta hydrolase [Myxococcota bacterium]
MIRSNPFRHAVLGLCVVFALACQSEESSRDVQDTGSTAQGAPDTNGELDTGRVDMGMADPDTGTSFTDVSTTDVSTSDVVEADATEQDTGPAFNPNPATSRFDPPDLGGWDGALGALPDPAELSEGFDGLDVTYLPDISCGPYAENLVDLIVPNGIESPPLLFFIHGGGFTGGSRLNTLGAGGRGVGTTVRYLEAGFAYATVDYRFLHDGGVQTPLQDVQVCLQFMRLHAEELGFDPERIVLAGGSAGAGTSLWIASHDDLAEPTHEHPVLRVSTEVTGIIITGTQATYDILAWNDVFEPEYPGILDGALTVPQIAQALLRFYDVDDAAVLEEEPYLSYRAAVHMLPKLDASDPPIWLQTNGDDTHPLLGGDPLHHPYHARSVVEAAEAAGVEVSANIQALERTTDEDRVEFALRVIGE